GQAWAAVPDAATRAGLEPASRRIVTHGSAFRLLDPAPKSPERSAKRHASLPWRLLALLIAMSGMSSLSLNILVPAIPSMVAKFATEPANVQLTVSLYLMGLAFAQLVFGPLSDR